MAGRIGLPLGGRRHGSAQRGKLCRRVERTPGDDNTNQAGGRHPRLATYPRRNPGRRTQGKANSARYQAMSPKRLATLTHWRRRAAFTGMVSLSLCLIAVWLDRKTFLPSYLFAWLFFLGLA